MMKKIGREIHDATGVLQIETPSSEHSRILDMCMAPGGFIATVLSLNPRSRTSGFTLPPSDGGHEVLLPRSTNVILKYLDITMLAEDMGVTKIQADHPDVKNFFPKQFEEGQAFHLVLCDGQVLRTQERAPYRKQREARRLINSQLALGLEHVRPGGTMIVLLHKAEAWDTVQLMYTFSKFSSVQLIKPMWFHAKRSSFYMVATKIQSHHPQAILAIEKWKEIWKVATFGTDEAYMETICKFETDVEVILRDFGEELVRLGKTVWDIQAKALARAPFIKAQENK
jgi:23S rRNA U2552 (ribose-2'-O)-methylase RlmE/FtsJ